jgi:hypothetical protein
LTADIGETLVRLSLTTLSVGLATLALAGGAGTTKGVRLQVAAEVGGIDAGTAASAERRAGRRRESARTLQALAR